MVANVVADETVVRNKYSRSVTCFLKDGHNWTRECRDEDCTQKAKDDCNSQGGACSQLHEFKAESTVAVILTHRRSALQKMKALGSAVG